METHKKNNPGDKFPGRSQGNQSAVTGYRGEPRNRFCSSFQVLDDYSPHKQMV